MCQRGWASDAYLQETFEFFVLSKDSLTSIIENSEEFKAFFAKETR
jgi:hypothetical protein